MSPTFFVLSAFASGGRPCGRAWSFTPRLCRAFAFDQAWEPEGGTAL